jgi:hypothetical protein
MQLTQSLRRLALPLLAAGALLAQPADQPQPVTKVSLFKVPLDKVGAFTAKGKQFLPVLDALFASGTVSAYGIENDYLHVPGVTNAVFWYTSANMTDLGKADEAVDAFAAKNPQLMADLHAMSDMSAHLDLIVRSPVMGTKPSSACVPKFGSMTVEKVKNGKVPEDVALFKKYWKSEMDALLNSGALCAYGYDVESFHSQAPGMTFRWVMAPDMGSFDKLRAASRAAWQKLSASEQKLLEAFDEANLDRAAHRDSLTSVVAYKSK